MVRESVVAGRFYPGDKATLSQNIEEYLSSAQVNIKDRISGLIVPHAGYPYSGQTAAYAYKALEDKDIRLAIILGPSHQASVRGFSVYDSGKWKTPLGTVDIDEDFAAALKKNSELIDYFPEAHSYEHSIEVQIPFLQKVLNDFKIVPISFNTSDLDKLKILVDALAGELKDRKKWVIVASTDLYHGPDYNEAREVTDKVNKYVSSFDSESLLDFDREMRAGGTCAACGASAAAVNLMTCQKLGANTVELLTRTTSGDVTGQKTGYIVGYGAWTIIKKNSSNQEKKEESAEKNLQSEGIMELSREEKVQLLEIARSTISEYVKNGNVPEFKIESEKLKRKSGAFVTLKKNGELRGCIGLIKAEKPLYKAIIDMAISAATKDPRFNPVKESEVEDIDIEISVLTPFQKLSDISEIKVGRDGLLIRRGIMSGLLLPQVPIEQNWDKMTFLKHTCYKAGLPPDAWKDSDIWKFQALVFSEKELEPQREGSRE